ncbi:hypothetical protein TTHERM_000339969 (macronuclear) [Tetrahymena thermophila SB210]|uniref:Uncharacterized protein n=1 Tax=Tetrahymena thermophila (strain SB210) TaxID=312017 RepID=W7XJC8_TETTS|nr:hypothetical protein TTHERM_000339969 [Tetrahymena thermophila SB210]EWS74044.1 hypothetical protein TTHERM_000339969 [Tetrahymena thermophila SB210]|eukprot:XP_012653443.1 hypothetical protein TTHERM_000339969 [Tetrahymena thermophila SB210]
MCQFKNFQKSCIYSCIFIARASQQINSQYCQIQFYLIHSFKKNKQSMVAYQFKSYIEKPPLFLICYRYRNYKFTAQGSDITQKVFDGKQQKFQQKNLRIKEILLIIIKIKNSFSYYFWQDSSDYLIFRFIKQI